MPLQKFAQAAHWYSWCHPCARAMLILSVSFQFKHVPRAGSPLPHFRRSSCAHAHSSLWRGHHKQSCCCCVAVERAEERAYGMLPCQGKKVALPRGASFGQGALGARLQMRMRAFSARLHQWLAPSASAQCSRLLRFAHPAFRWCPPCTGRMHLASGLAAPPSPSPPSPLRPQHWLPWQQLLLCFHCSAHPAGKPDSEVQGVRVCV